MDEGLTFTLSGALAGARRTIPLVIGGVAYGLVFGVLARRVGLTLVPSLAMSGLVFAGTSELIAIGLWATPPPVVLIILTTCVVNLRHLLMGAAIHPWFSRLPAIKSYSAAFFMTDETWALTMRELKDGRYDAAFLVGSGLMLWISGMIGTGAGYVLGAMVQDPAAWGLDFIFVGLFVALLVDFWRGKSDALPWTVAAAVAVMAALWLPGKWYILLGGLAGSVVGGVRDAA